VVIVGSFIYCMRSLHRDVGYFIIGLTIIYSISGVVLIYRNTDFLKSEKQIEKQISPNLKESELGGILHVRNLEIVKIEGDIISFRNGTYNMATGVVNYSEKTLPAFLERFNNLHKKASGSISYLFSTIFGVLLLFLAISSFWMFKPTTKMFRRGIIFTGSGLLLAIILLFLK
jgi:hypothetical protein